MDILEGFSVIPRNLDMAVDTLATWYEPQLIGRIKRHEVKSTALHNTNGRFLRNIWIYVDDSPLASWFYRKGIRHPDDMSQIVIESTFRKIKGEDVRLDKQIEHVRSFWESKGINPDEL